MYYVNAQFLYVCTHTFTRIFVNNLISNLISLHIICLVLNEDGTFWPNHSTYQDSNARALWLILRKLTVLSHFVFQEIPI